MCNYNIIMCKLLIRAVKQLITTNNLQNESLFT